MATTYAATTTINSATMGGPNGPTRPIMIPTHLDNPMAPSSPLSTSQPSSRLNVPPPNPPFVFPARPSSPGSSFHRAMGRRPRSVVEIPTHSLDLNTPPVEHLSAGSSALPDFTFNPGAPTNSQNKQPDRSTLPNFSFNPGASQDLSNSFLSPPHSPMTPRTIPARQGHRRSGSEFVGGNVRAGESITVMSTSPTRSDGGSFPSPTLAPVTPSPRRGHAHRRSAAISSHDLSLILKPPNPNHKGSSAPTSPADFNSNKVGSFPDMRRDSSKSESEVAVMQHATVLSPILSASGPPTPEIRIESNPTARSRVGFSDTLEFIPRPLSLISTDTGSTVTARPGHSGSGSVSSIASMTNSNAAGRETPSVPSSPSSSKKGGESRPSTAGAVLEHAQDSQALEGGPQSPRRRNSIPLLIGLPQEGSSSPTNPSPVKTPKRWSFFGLDPFASTGSPTRSRPVSSHSIGPLSRTPDIANPSSKSDRVSTRREPGQRSASRASSVKKKKQKKVKSWAGSILTRTSKSSRSRKKAARRQCPTPPPPRPLVDEEFSDHEEEVFHGTYDAPPPTVLVTEPLSPNDTPDHSTAFQVPPAPPAEEDDASYQMIDLDAALGPFNTPSARDPAWEAAQRAGAPPKRQLHSAAGMRNFTGPGMHYHRRTESAPALAPFEPGRFGIPRFGSSSTMADVFEEDEEEEEDNSGAEATSEKSGTGTRNGSTDAISTVSSSDYDTTPTQERDIGVAASKDTSPVSSVKRKDSGSSLEVPPSGSKVPPETSGGSLHGDIIMEEDFGHFRYRRDTNFSGISDTSDSPAPSPRTVPNKALFPADYSMNLPAPSFAPASPFSGSHSSFPSPRSPISYDAQRISTAASSIADENNFQSLLMGEPGPEVVRMSFEVPSLTSTNSTMTRDSMFVPGAQPRNMPFHDQRPASFTTTAFGRRRSSLAGLSRLISSAHGERSKLSVEVPCDDEPEKKPRASKTKRLSRIMQFWKPKESKQP